MLFKYICLYIKLQYIRLKYKLSIRSEDFQKGGVTHGKKKKQSIFCNIG